MITLWSFSLEFKRLENAIADIEEDRELSPSDREQELQKYITAWFEPSIRDHYNDKYEELAGYINYQDSLIKARKAEITRLQALVDRAENRANQLRKCLAEEMNRAHLTRIENERCIISLREKKPQLVIQDSPDDIPQEYANIEYSYNKKAIINALKNGEKLDWAQLISTKEKSLIIR